MRREKPDPANVSPEERRRAAAIRLRFRHQFEGKPLEQCWAEVHPDSKIDRETARLRAEEEIGWLRRNRPLRISEELLLYNLDTDALIGDLEKQLSATKKIPFRVIRKGRRVTVTGTIEVKDNRARNLALDQLIEIAELSRPEDPSTEDHLLRRS